MAFSDKTKEEVRRRAHEQCCLCHEYFIDVHHLTPESEKGPDTFENAVPLCQNCHSRYGGNPTKRERLRISRDAWYAECEGKTAALDLKPMIEALGAAVKELQQGQSRLLEVREAQHSVSPHASPELAAIAQLSMPECMVLVLESLFGSFPDELRALCYDQVAVAFAGQRQKRADLLRAVTAKGLSRFFGSPQDIIPLIGAEPRLKECARAVLSATVRSTAKTPGETAMTVYMHDYALRALVALLDVLATKAMEEIDWIIAKSIEDPFGQFDLDVLLAELLRQWDSRSRASRDIVYRLLTVGIPRIRSRAFLAAIELGSGFPDELRSYIMRREHDADHSVRAQIAVSICQHFGQCGEEFRQMLSRMMHDDACRGRILEMYRALKDKGRVCGEFEAIIRLYTQLPLVNRQVVTMPTIDPRIGAPCECGGYISSKVTTAQAQDAELVTLAAKCGKCEREVALSNRNAFKRWPEPRIGGNAPLDWLFSPWGRQNDG